MKIIVAKDYEEMSRLCGELIAESIKENPKITLGLATGSTPIGTYKTLIDAHQSGLDLSQVTTFNLDEYKGLENDNDQSYHYFMKTELLDHVNINSDNTFFPNDFANPADYDDVIAEKGGIDLQLLGIGNNGHLAFNEPGEKLNVKTSLVDLADSTILANARFFDKIDEVPTQAISMGMGTIFNAKRLVIIAAGSAKREAIQMLKDQSLITTLCPVTIALLHPDVTLIVDKEAYGD